MSDDGGATKIDDETLPETDEGTPVVHSHVTESRSGAALDTGDEFIVLFHDRAVRATVDSIETGDDQ